ncbi:MAG: hypothetical protein ACJ8DI_08335 [Ktedonobacteraceae bacterium]
MLKRSGMLPLLVAETTPTRGGNCPYSWRKTVFLRWLPRQARQNQRRFTLVVSVALVSRRAWQRAALPVRCSRRVRGTHSGWNRERGRKMTMKELQGWICRLSHFGSDRSQPVALAGHPGDIQKRLFLHVSSSARPYRNVHGPEIRWRGAAG